VRVEEKTQMAIFDWLKLQHPDVIACSESSGIRCSMGMARKLKKMRSNHTHLDIIVFEKRGPYGALLIELKAKNIYKKSGELLKNEHLEDQQKTINLLNAKGYKACFAVGFDEAIRAITDYLNAN
jgi:hypothetical protein